MTVTEFIAHHRYSHRVTRSPGYLDKLRAALCLGVFVVFVIYQQAIVHGLSSLVPELKVKQRAAGKAPGVKD
jgi:hypothetical protein